MGYKELNELWSKARSEIEPRLLSATAHLGEEQEAQIIEKIEELKQIIFGEES